MAVLKRDNILKDCLALGIFLAALLLVLPFFLEKPPEGKAPTLSWAPGYWETSPLLGIMRIVPLAPASLVNPAAARAPANFQEDKNLQPIDRANL